MPRLKQRYLVVIRFTGGLLAGLEYTNTQDWPMTVGLRIDQPIAGSPYVVLSCTPV